MPAISILLPFHGNQVFLSEAIDSVLDQTFSDWELLLINNNADDDTLKIAKMFKNKDSRIKLIAEQKQGIGFALNKGLEMASSELIARLDADDISLPLRLEKQYEFLKKNKDIAAIACKCEIFPKTQFNKGFQHFVSWQNEIITANEHAENRFIESPLAHPSIMFHKSLIEKYGAYTTADVPEDYELWLRWMHEGVKISKLEDVLLNWRDHEQRLSRTVSAYSANAFDKIRVEYLAALLRKNNIIERNIIICGTGKNSIRRSRMLQNEGIKIFAHTDVVKKSSWANYLYPNEAIGSENAYFINFISDREVRPRIIQWLHQHGKVSMRDYIMAA
jgi:glycosyltransferase involved in cell wall biosynthesis